MNRTKKILTAEGIFVAMILIYLFFSTTPSQIYPLQGMAIKEPFSFKIKNAEEILISKDKNFTASFTLKKGEEVILEPGIYYWKVRNGFRESEIRNFSVEGYVALNLKELNESYELQNAGNVLLNVTKIGEKKKANIIIDIGESEFFEKDNSVYEGRQI